MKTINDRGLLAYFSQHRVAANLMMIIVVLAGALALRQLQTQLMPDVNIPGVTINTSWPNTGARTVEQTLTTPLENGLRNLKGVEDVWSWSRAGHSEIYVRFNISADPDEKLNEVTRYLASYSVPEGAEKPVARLDEWDEDVFSLLLTTEGPVNELRPLIQQFRNDLLARGVAKVNVEGFADEEIRVQSNMAALAQQGTNVSSISQAIAISEFSNPAGTLRSNNTATTVTTQAPELGLAELTDISLINQRPLGSFTDIERQTVKGAREFRWQGQNAVRLIIYRSTEIDSLTTADIVQDWIAEVRPTLSPGQNLVIWWDSSEIVRGNLNMLISNGLVGLILVVGILFFFLNRQVALWSAVGIPISIAGTFMLLFSTGGTINFLSVFAFLMALGIIVDDAIVVGEETVTQMEKGKSASEASLIAAKRMFAPIIASSLTTIAAFLPLLMLPGPFGELLRPVPIVIISVISASLIECFLILPGHLNHSLSKRTRTPSKFRLKMDSGFQHFRDQWYRPLVTWSINNRGITVLTATCLIVIAAAMPITNTVPFSPELEVEDNVISAWISFHQGTEPEVVTSYTEKMKAALAQADSLHPDVNIVQEVYEIASTTTGFTRINARLIDRDERPVSNSDFLKDWGSFIEQGPEVNNLSINQDRSSNQQGSRVSFFIAGRDLNTLTQAAETLKRRFESYEFLSDIQDDLPRGDDEVIFVLNATGRQLGLTENNVAQQLQQVLNGRRAARINESDAVIPVIVAPASNLFQSSAGLQDIPITTNSGQFVRFGDIATTETIQGLGTLFHENGQLGVRVSAALLDEEANASAISRQLFESEVEPIMEQFGLSATIQGSARDIDEMLNNLIFAAIAGLFLVYFILVWVFSSYTWPLAVMSAIPFALTGAIFGHWIMDLNLTFLSFFGLFGLSGIIINDSIILINRYQELREDGVERTEAIIEASTQRLRAVLLTSITTVSGLIPLLMSDSIQAQLVKSMATSLAFGITYGTVLVLLVIPCLLMYIESMNERVLRFKQWLKRSKPRVSTQ